MLRTPGGLRTIAAVGVLSVGISSKITQDDDREWWSRAGAWILIIGTSWLLFSSVVLLLPRWTQGLFERWPLRLSSVTALIGWLISRAGASEKTSADLRGDQPSTKSKGILNRAQSFMLPAAAILFVLALVRTLVALNGLLARLVPGGDCSLLAVEIAVGVLASYWINVNKFSLHAMYRMRLVRAYLGASDTVRNPNPFTGFDIADNLEMHSLHLGKPMARIESLFEPGSRHKAWLAAA